MQYNLPTITLKGLITLPDQEIKLEINNKLTKKTILLAKKEFESKILVICPKNYMEEEPDVSDLPKVGVVAEIISSVTLPNGNDRVVLKGLNRVSVDIYFNLKKYHDILLSKVQNIEIPKLNNNEKEALRRKLMTLLKKYIKVNPSISNSILSQVIHVNSLDKLTDMISSFLPLAFSRRLELMQEIHAKKRALLLINYLSVELEIIDLENKIDEDLNFKLDNSQKEFILREKVKLIKNELGEKSSKDIEIDNFNNMLENGNYPSDVYNLVKNEIHKFELISEVSPELSSVRNHINVLLNLPWNIESDDQKDINKAKKILDSTHYGLDEIKKRILEFLYVKQINPSIDAPIICLVGPPGIGKSTLASSIAKAMNRSFVSINVGGLNDPSELIGYQRTYVGSTYGKIINGYLQAKTNNPLFLIDEIDKMSNNYKGNPSSTLLNILDVNQNNKFIDNFIDYPFDLSNTLFILTANYIDHIPYELRNRLEIFDLNTYTIFEKIKIAKKYLIPKCINKYKLDKKIFMLDDKLINILINSYTCEPGVRDLEKCIDLLYRKIIFNEDIKMIKSITQDYLIKYLGKEKYSNFVYHKWTYGNVNCLACSGFGGEVLPVETVFTLGHSSITGLLGKTMQESVSVADSYISSHLKEFNILEDDYRKGMHIHFLDGSSNKEGTSAGLSIVTSAISLLKKKVVPRNIAFTGEISLTGNIIKIGGLKEKLIAAYNEGMKHVFIPLSNEADLDDIPAEVLKKLDIHLVSDYMEIYNYLFKKN